MVFELHAKACLSTVRLCADKDSSVRPDWAHVYLAVLPLLPLQAAKDEAKIAVALRCARSSLIT